jgi:hypothetical protein
VAAKSGQAAQVGRTRMMTASVIMTMRRNPRKEQRFIDRSRTTSLQHNAGFGSYQAIRRDGSLDIIPEKHL